MLNENNNTGNQQGKNEPRSSLRTFKADTAEYVRSKKLSAIDIAALKERSKEGMPISFSPPNRSSSKIKVLLIIMTTIIVAAGATAAFFLLKKGGEPETTAVIEPVPASILQNQKEQPITGDSLSNFKSQFKEFLRYSYSLGALIYLPVKKNTADGGVSYLTSGEFLQFLSNNTPAPLVNYLADNFFLGIINLESKHAVLIFEAKKGQYDTVFTGMLQWEPTILKDINFVLSREVPVDLIPEFKDKLVQNQTVRIAANGEEVFLVYTLLDKKYIIITDDQKTLQEIIHRFELFKFS